MNSEPAHTAPGPPRISVALCTYNGARYVEEQLRSILEQTVKPAELVVSDDGSSDDTVARVRRLTADAQFPVRILESPENQGVVANFGKAMGLCSGDYIALSDQDDLWYPDKLERFSEAITASASGAALLLYSDPDLIDSSGAPSGKTLHGHLGLSPPLREHWRMLCAGNFVPGCTMVFSARLLDSMLPIPPDAIMHDWWLALLCSVQGELHCLDRPLMAYRLHGDNTQGVGSARKAAVAGAKRGFVRLAAENFVVTLRQLRAARERLDKLGVATPPDFEAICDVLQQPPWRRPLLLARLGVQRGRPGKTLLTRLASVFASRRQLENRALRYV